MRPPGLDEGDRTVVVHLADLLAAPLGDVAPHRIEQLEHPAFVELHDRDRGDRLGHRVDAEDGVVGHREVTLTIHQAEGPLIGHVAAPHHGHLAAGDLAGVHVLGSEVLRDALEPRLAHPRRFGFDLGRS